MPTNFSDFTTSSSISGSEFLVGYRAPVSGGEMKTTASTLRNFMLSGLNVWIPASQFIPRTTSGAGIDSREIGVNNFDELLFDPAATEFAQALVAMPGEYNNGLVRTRFSWTASGATGSVVWGAQALSISNGAEISGGFGATALATGSITGNNLLSITTSSNLNSLTGSITANRLALLQIYRDAASVQDTLSIDARLLGVELLYNIT
jgi:hypothetical protein